LGLTQQNVSKHLQILHRNGLVTRRPEGSSVIYALRDSSTVRLLDDVVTGVSDHLRELSELATGAADDLTGAKAHPPQRAADVDV
jgi:DNA-binding transcriptional ArsR family regulator